MKVVLWAIIGLLIYILVVILINVSLSRAADLFPARPEGFAGEGHAANHAHYEGLRSPNGQSCCNGRDCRPTQARQIGGQWQIMVNGNWRSDFDNGEILTDAWLRLEQIRLHYPVEGRWNTQAHVCASIEAQYSGATTPPRPNIYCVILTDIWN